MELFNNVRSTAISVPLIEVNVDTVYVRNNIKRIVEGYFDGWEYDETQYSVNEYIEQLTKEEDSSMLALMVSMLMDEVDELKNVVRG